MVNYDYRADIFFRQKGINSLEIILDVLANDPREELETTGFEITGEDIIVNPLGDYSFPRPTMLTAIYDLLLGSILKKEKGVIIYPGVGMDIIPSISRATIGIENGGSIMDIKGHWEGNLLQVIYEDARNSWNYVEKIKTLEKRLRDISIDWSKHIDGKRILFVKGIESICDYKYALENIRNDLSPDCIIQGNSVNVSGKKAHSFINEELSYSIKRLGFKETTCDIFSEGLIKFMGYVNSIVSKGPYIWKPALFYPCTSFRVFKNTLPT